MNTILHSIGTAYSVTANPAAIATKMMASIEPAVGVKIGSFVATAFLLFPVEHKQGAH